MTMQPTGIHRGAKTLSIMPTFTCTAACTNCGTLSSPQERTNLALPAILDAITEAKQLGFKVVVFTGGETTLRWRDLLAAIRHATDLALWTRIVTNAHWATSLARADGLLGTLIDHGLCEINYSTGDEHARFVPLERVVFATVAAARRRFRTHVVVELRGERQVTRATLEEAALLATLTPDERSMVTINESSWMPIDPTDVETYPPGVAITRDNLHRTKGCRGLLSAYTLQADARIGACCGLGLRVIPELNVATTADDHPLTRAIDEAESDLLKLWIHYSGPFRILAWAAEKDPTIEWEGAYAHPCQACQRVYRDPKVGNVLKDHVVEIEGDVVQRAWLAETGWVSALARPDDLA